MKNLTIDDYLSTIDKVLDIIDRLPEQLKPKCIIHNGNIKNPGISDLDLIFGFEDDFVQAKYFLHLFESKIDSLDNKNIYFHHLPHIYPLSSLKSLPKMTYNPKNQINVLSGKIIFEEEKLNYHQNVLNSFEQVHNRLNMLINLKVKSENNINSLLLVGHSLKHSIKCINLLGIELNESSFKYFNIIEDMREEYTLGKKLINFDFGNLCLGLIGEFFRILNLLNGEIDKMVDIHFSKNLDKHQYHDKFYLINLNKNVKSPKLHFKDPNLLIEGFNWQTLCIFENYFLSEDNHKTIFKDLDFKDQINLRVDFFKKIFLFNFNNFNNPIGRSSIKPLILGSKLNYLSRKILNVI